MRVILIYLILASTILQNPNSAHIALSRNKEPWKFKVPRAEAKMEQEAEIEPYESTLLQSKSSIRWRVHNVSELIRDNSWTAMTILFEARGSLGRSYTWKISLFADDDYLYGRTELVAPVKFRIPYHMKFHIVGKSEEATITEEEDPTPREIMSQAEPQKWKIIQRKYLKLLKNDEDVMELDVEVKCFGSETTKGVGVQNHPF